MMTENKRFTYENHKVNDTLTGDVHSSNRVSVNVLNELHEENEELKENCRNYEWYKEYKKLLNENEQLKQKIQGLKDDRTRFEEEARIDAIDKALDEENQQLQNQIEMLKTTIARNEAYIHQLTSKGEWRK